MSEKFKQILLFFENMIFRIFYRKNIQGNSFFSWLKKNKFDGVFFLKDNNFKQKKIRIHLEYLR